MMKRILRESVSWSKMRHKNILPLIGFWKGFDSKQDESCLSFITPWMDDGDLLSYLQSHSDLDSVRRLRYVSLLNISIDKYAHRFSFTTLQAL